MPRKTVWQERVDELIALLMADVIKLSLGASGMAEDGCGGGRVHGPQAANDS